MAVSFFFVIVKQFRRAFLGRETALPCSLLRCCRWLESIALAMAISLSNPVDFTRYIHVGCIGMIKPLLTQRIQRKGRER
jgi:hypothetical protein